MRLSKQRARKASRVTRRGVERLEQRQLLAGDLIAQWQASELVGTYEDGQAVESWSDSVALISADSKGSPTFVSNAIGGRPAVRFDATEGNAYFVVPKATSPLSRADNFTVAVVFSTSSNELAGDGSAWIDGTGLVHANQQGFNEDWGITLHGEGQVAAGLGRGFLEPFDSIVSSDVRANDGDRHFVTMTRQRGDIALYVDDAPAITLSGADDASRASVDFYIGDAVRGFTGDIAEVRIFNGALDANEVASLKSEVDSFYGNLPPVANDDSYVASEDSPLFVSSANGLLVNDIDADGDTLTAVVVDEPENGTLAINPNGTFIYDPFDNFFGVDTFTYSAVDFRPSEPATVTIEVRNTLDVATAIEDTYKALPNEILRVESGQGILVNDINLDASELMSVVDSDVSNGSLVLRPDGSFDYDAQGFSGIATFSYRISDRGNLSEPATVTFVVNTPPTIADDRFTLSEDVPLELDTSSGVRANDVDADGNPFTLVLVDPPARGTLTFGDDGAFTYTPEANFFGTDLFTYSATDGIDSTGKANVVLTIEPVNDAPVVTAEAYFVAPDQQLNVPANEGLLANDFDIEGANLLVRVIGNPTNGRVEVQADGEIQYTPNPGFIGEDRVRYEVQDDANATTEGQVEFFVGVIPVKINEVASANATNLATSVRPAAGARLGEDILTPDWIELKNFSSSPLDISGLHLTDDPNHLTKWQFPPETFIPPNDFAVVLASKLNVTDRDLDEFGRLHTNFKLSDRAGEYVALSSADGEIIDELADMPAQAPDVSYGRAAEEFALMAPTPGAANAVAYEGIVDEVRFDQPRGFYDEAFHVGLTTSTPNSEIYYTTNGSVPSPETGLLYSEPIAIETTATLRARAFRSNFAASPTGTQSYLFAADVIQQPITPEGFPDRWGRAGRADYEMDPRVATDAESEFFDPNVADALRSLPTISITMEVEEFFGVDGIQSNPTQKGDDWERSTSVEFIDFEHFDDYQIDSGIRMVGNASRGIDRRKHNMRLAFRDDYGDSSLPIPLFNIGPGEEHQNIILRGGNGDSWVNSGVYRRAQYIRDQWQRDMQVAMEDLTTSQLYSHLYINGLYWGLYHVFERHDASFMALHMGGDEEDYDAIKDLNGNTAVVEAVSGDVQAWEDMMDVIDDRDLSVEEKYIDVQKRIDIDNMINYLLINFYAGNNDWDHNNFRAGRSRDETGRFIFFTWDAERQDINALGTPAAGGPVTIDVTAFSKAGRPSRIHATLSGDEEYRLRFADAVQKHFYNGGALTPDRASGLWNARADEIRLAMSAESARWGDLHSRRSPQLVADWEATLTRMNDEFFPARTDIVVSQFRRRNVFPDFDAPTFSQMGGDVVAGLQLSIEATEGTIWLTTDGSDPRLPGGATSDIATMYESPISISSEMIVNARVLLNGEWSALTSATFQTPTIPADDTNLRISEIHFNPAAPSEAEIDAGFTDNDEFEFIEIANISTRPIDLSQVHLASVGDEGVVFEFSSADTTRLEPNMRALIVEDRDAFQFRYGSDLPVLGQWVGRLSNGGELISLQAGDQIIQQFAYDDDWHAETDGQGSSLEIIDVASAELDLWEIGSSWQPSQETGGTPGTSVPARVPGDSNGDGIFNSSDLVLVFDAGEYEDAVAGNSTYEEGDWNGDGDFDSRDLVFAFQADTFVNAAIATEDLTGLRESVAHAVVSTDDLIESHRKLRKSHSLFYSKAR